LAYTLTFLVAFEFNPNDPSSANYWPAIFQSPANWTQQSLSASQWVMKGTAASGFAGWTVRVTALTTFGPPSTPGGMPTGEIGSLTLLDQNGVDILQLVGDGGSDVSALATDVPAIFRKARTFVGSSGDDLYVDPDHLEQTFFSTTIAISGGAGNDTLTGGTSGSPLRSVHVSGGEGNDLIQGGNRNAVLSGDEGADTIRGGAGLDRIYADGDDLMIDGGAGGAEVYLTSLAVVKLGGVAGPGEVLMRNVTLLGLDAFSTDPLGNAFAMDVHAAADWTTSITIEAGSGDDVIVTGSGNDRISFEGGGDYFDAGAGSDTLDLLGRTASIDLRLTTPQDMGDGDVGTFLNFENVTGAQGTVWGTEGANSLSNANTVYGLGGDDTLSATIAYGGDGNDTLSGGTLYGDGGDDTLNGTTAYGGDGNDTLNGTTAYGGDGNDTLTGATLYGDGGDDQLNGSTMVGGTGDDTYAVPGEAIATVVVTEEADGGIDTVELGAVHDVHLTYQLPDFVENLTFAGPRFTGYGNAENNIIVSGYGNDDLYGYNGNDTLYGGSGYDRLEGGSGSDAMYGGWGNDIYQVGNRGDSVHENANEGNDLIESTVTYTLAANVEKLTLMGTAGINGTGNELANLLSGNGAANVLSGLDGDDTLYGLNGDDTLYGGAGNDRLEGGSGRDAMYGGAGDDAYQVGNNADSVHENANEGIDIVESTISYTLAANVEKLTLMGTAALNGTGNELSNTLNGTVAANVLDGGGGVDILRGGAGDDTYIVDQAGDKVIEQQDQGIDMVLSFASYHLSAWIENLTLTGTSAINADGNTLANILVGNAAANRLDGMAGNDEMRGGKGDDTYVVDQAGDKVHELKDEGIDTVLSSISYDLTGQYLENLTLVGTSAINGTGNSFGNILVGNAAANRLDGLTGADEMRGGKGNDTYVVSQTGDRAYELNNQGVDTVLSSVSYDLTGQFIEKLTLTGTSMIDATGNTLDNVLIGNSAANLLDGKDGVDEMRGGKGNDTYIVSQTGDKAYELEDEGVDTVLSSVSYDLTGQFIERLTLTGTAAINATGNTLDNVLTGNATDNRLDGMTGVDRVYGGAGDDTYVVSQAGDKAYELNDEGIDTVLSSVSYDLAGQYIENLTLTGTSAINATGNTLDNTLVGNNAANVLDGGAGNDILRGNGGNDIFSFSTSPALVADPDIIRDFSNVSGNNDSIRLDHLAFTALSATGPLSAAAFKDLALGAKDSSDRIVYDSARGDLYYDADGSGAIQAVRFAHLDNHATLTNADFSVI